MRLIHRLGIGFVDMMLLGFGLVAIYFQAVPVAEWGIVTVDAFWLMIVVVSLYITVNIFSSLCLMYMREDNAIAKAIKSLVMTILVVAIFSWVLFPVLWIFGYSMAADAKNILMIVSVIRTLVKIWLNRRWGGYEK